MTRKRTRTMTHLPYSTLITSHNKIPTMCNAMCKPRVNVKCPLKSPLDRKRTRTNSTQDSNTKTLDSFNKKKKNSRNIKNQYTIHVSQCRLVVGRHCY